MYHLNEYPIFSSNNKYSMLTIASGVVLVQNGKVLVVRESDETMFSFPGGTCSNNESFEQTAIREVQEELGLSVTIVENPYIFEFERSDGMHNELLLLFHFPVSAVMGRLHLGSDAKQRKWVSINDNFSDCFPNVEYAVRHFLHQYGPNPGYRIVE